LPERSRSIVAAVNDRAFVSELDHAAAMRFVLFSHHALPGTPLRNLISNECVER